jgi:hypothetical protein
MRMCRICPRAPLQEADSYLKFILDHYDDLPPRMIFTHGHLEAWHVTMGPAKSSTLGMLRHLNVTRAPFMSLTSGALSVAQNLHGQLPVTFGLLSLLWREPFMQEAMPDRVPSGVRAHSPAGHS